MAKNSTKQKKKNQERWETNLVLILFFGLTFGGATLYFVWGLSIIAKTPLWSVVPENGQTTLFAGILVLVIMWMIGLAVLLSRLFHLVSNKVLTWYRSMEISLALFIFGLAQAIASFLFAQLGWIVPDLWTTFVYTTVMAWSAKFFGTWFFLRKRNVEKTES